ncbi:SGNH/GDSL hydrolase family protein [Williamsia sp. M5A3_1d]
MLILVAVLAAGTVLAGRSQRDASPRVDVSAQLDAANQTDLRFYSDAPSSVQFRKPAGRAASLLFVGGSLTGGYFATRSALGFAKLVSNAINSVPQQTAERANETLSTVSATTMPAGLDLAVVELGTNDWDATPLNRFRTQYDLLVKRIRMASPKTALVCLGVWRDNTNGYDAQIEQSCLAADGIFVPLARLYRDQKNRGPAGVRVERGTSDDFRPNDRGHAVIANAVLGAIDQKPVAVPVTSPAAPVPPSS